MKVGVAITIDVEFTVGGAFEDPQARQPVGTESVELRIGDEGAGLDFILNTLETNGLRGVFFVEAMNTYRFGDAPMGAIARRIRERGHDVQLHAHPCWLAFMHADWQARVAQAPPCDSLAGLPNEAIERVVQSGLNVFSRWGLPRPCAFRAGNLQVDRRIYGVLEKFGIPLASNVGLGAYLPAEQELRLAGGRHWVGGTLEVPVSSYADVQLPGLSRWKSFTIVGTGRWEARQWLEDAVRVGIDPVVILTHPLEFVYRQGEGYAKLRRNHASRQRLALLCEFLSEHRSEFDVITFSDRVVDWTSRSGTGDPKWRVSPLARALRVIENRISELGKHN